MSETKHTPGPWFAHGRYIGTKNHKSAIGECRDVNGNWSDDVKSSGNAHLIAAAPDLLAALKKMLPEANRIDQHLRPTFETCEEARAAIAKAEGRS